MVDPPGGAPQLPAGSSSCLGTHNSAHPRLGPLTVSADTQAIKPKVSRIHARCIFPGDVARTRIKRIPVHVAEGLEKVEAELPPGERLGLGFQLWLSSLAPALAFPLRPGNAAPSHLLASALPTQSCCFARLLFLVWSYSALCFHSANSGVRVAVLYDLKQAVDGLKPSCR